MWAYHSQHFGTMSVEKNRNQIFYTFPCIFISIKFRKLKIQTKKQNRIISVYLYMESAQSINFPFGSKLQFDLIISSVALAIWHKDIEYLNIISNPKALFWYKSNFLIEKSLICGKKTKLKPPISPISLLLSSNEKKPHLSLKCASIFCPEFRLINCQKIRSNKKTNQMVFKLINYYCFHSFGKNSKSAKCQKRWIVRADERKKTLSQMRISKVILNTIKTIWSTRFRWC